ncbi:MAG: large conductance mechanosensitive channel protein MscL [Chthoniobacterales bacterium]|nr:large conductance mechanosensitive channel protein MscL [Chthoniobacterales bacterium]
MIVHFLKEFNAGFLKEFKEFISRGHVVDLAIGVIIGSALSKVVNSLVNDIVMPPIGLLLRGINFQNLFLSLDGHHYGTLGEAQRAGAATINYGSFITVTIEFLIITFCVFMVIKTINTLQRTNTISFAAPLTKTDALLTEIRDELRKEQQAQ